MQKIFIYIHAKDLSLRGGFYLTFLDDGCGMNYGKFKNKKRQKSIIIKILFRRCFQCDRFRKIR